MASYFGNGINGGVPSMPFGGLTPAQLIGNVPTSLAVADTFTRQQNPDESDKTEEPDKTKKHAAAEVEENEPLTPGKKAKSFFKGLVSPFTDPFQSVKSFMIAAGIFAVHAAIIGATGGAAAIPFLALAGAGALYHIVKGGVEIHRAKTGEEKKKAWHNIGAGIGNMALLGFGAKTALKESSTVDAAKVDKMNMAQALKENYKQMPTALRDSRAALTGGHAMANTKTYMKEHAIGTVDKVKNTRQRIKGYRSAPNQPWHVTARTVLGDLFSALSYNSLLGIK
jgi:hypothetical protein